MFEAAPGGKRHHRSSLDSTWDQVLTAMQSSADSEITRESATQIGAALRTVLATPAYSTGAFVRSEYVAADSIDIAPPLAPRTLRSGRP